MHDLDSCTMFNYVCVYVYVYAYTCVCIIVCIYMIAFVINRSAHVS